MILTLVGLRICGRDRELKRNQVCIYVHVVARMSGFSGGREQKGQAGQKDQSVPRPQGKTEFGTNEE